MPREEPPLPDVNVTAPAPKPAPDPTPTPASPATGGTGIELAALRVTFNVHKMTLQSPDQLEAKIYNLSPATMQKILQFTRVQLSAGYQFANFGLLFDGLVVQYRRGKENPTDTYLEIIAGDGDNVNGATSFRRFEAGTTEGAAINQLIQDTGYPAGHISSSVGTQVLQRPWIVAGATQQYLREMALKYNANLWVDGGQVYIVDQSEYKPGEAVVLSPQSGLVNIPELTPSGIQVRCLINPKIQLGGLIKLDKQLISGVAFVPGSGQEFSANVPSVPQEALGPGAGLPGLPALPQPAVGTYKILMMEVSGDTRGQPWYMDLTCIGMDDSTGQPLPAPPSVWNRSRVYGGPGT
jgi:hypothetical protein